MRPGLVNVDESSRSISEVKADLFKALAHPARVRILEVLASGPRSVGQLQSPVGIEASHLSQQLAVLRRSGLIVSTKQGAAVTYELVDPAVIELLQVARQLLIKTLTPTRDLLNDLTDPGAVPEEGPAPKKGRGATGA